MSIKCLLCESPKVVNKEAVCVKDLIRQYVNTTYGEHVSKEFDGVAALNFLGCEECGLLFFDPPVSGSKEFYDRKQAASDAYYLDEKPEYDFARKYVRSTDRVLEIGCGKGAFSKCIRPLQYQGLEFSQEAIEKALSAGINVSGQPIEEHSKRFPHYYDVVCYFQVLEHIAGLRAFLNASVECLKPGGLLIISVPNADSYLSWLPNCLPNLPPHHVSHWPEKAVRSIGELFFLDLEAIHFEQLNDRNLQGYSRAVFFAILNEFFRLRIRLVDSSFHWKIKNKAANVCTPFLKRFYFNHHFRPRGHSVTAVFGKRR